MQNNICRGGYYFGCTGGGTHVRRCRSPGPKIVTGVMEEAADAPDCAAESG